MPQPDAKGSFSPVPTTEDWQAPLKGGIDIAITPEMLADCQAGHLSFWVDVYANRSRDGAPYYSLQLRRREYRPKDGAAVAPASADALEEFLPPIDKPMPSADPDDEVPF